ncbi:hypothetical protein Tco_0172817 [Tanacetum coccineum]
MPHESFLRVTSLGGDEGSLKQKPKELMKFCTTLQSQQTQMTEKIQSQDLEIKLLKARIQTLEDAQNPREGISSRSTNKEVRVQKQDDLSNVLSSIDCTNILAKDPTAEVLTTSRDTTPYTRRPRDSREVVIRSTSYIPISIPSAGKEDKRKGKEIMTESEKHLKLKEQIERDAEIARIHAEEDLRQMINELDRSNVMINKHMAEYEEAENDLTIEEKTENPIGESQGKKRLKTSDVSSPRQQESDNQMEIINLQQWVVLVREESSVNITPSVVKLPIYDLVTLWKLVKDRFKIELPKSDLEKCLFWPIKVMFKPVATDLLWQFEAPIKSWKMYKSCKVHCLSMEGMIIYMLDDVEYPFQKTTLKKMLDHKCVVSEFIRGW